MEKIFTFIETDQYQRTNDLIFEKIQAENLIWDSIKNGQNITITSIEDIKS